MSKMIFDNQFYILNQGRIKANFLKKRLARSGKKLQWTLFVLIVQNLMKKDFLSRLS
jgi:hypothetical protein